ALLLRGPGALFREVLRAAGAVAGQRLLVCRSLHFLAPRPRPERSTPAPRARGARRLDERHRPPARSPGAFHRGCMSFKSIVKALVTNRAVPRDQRGDTTPSHEAPLPDGASNENPDGLGLAELIVEDLRTHDYDVLAP